MGFIKVKRSELMEIDYDFYLGRVIDKACLAVGLLNLVWALKVRIQLLDLDLDSCNSVVGF